MTAPANGRKCPLSGKQEGAIRALLAGKSIVEAARAAGTHERTLRRWLAQEPFKTALQAAQEAATRDALASLERALSEGIEALRELLGPDTPHATRRAAASDLVRHGLTAFELANIERRLDDLERRLTP